MSSRFSVALPEVYNLLVSSLISFFGEQPVTTTVQEARAWSFDAAWATFHWGLVLAAGGAATLIWWIYRKMNPAYVFVLVWTGIILASTAAHLRYEYYLAANIALLAAVFAGAVINVTWKDAARLFRSESGDILPDTSERQEKAKKGKKGARARDTGKPKVSAKDRADLKVGRLLRSSSSHSLWDPASQQPRDGPDREARWYRLTVDGGAGVDGCTSPDPGVDYYAIHDKETFIHPDEAYGVMSWWDYGHWITYISKRIPNNNPSNTGLPVRTAPRSTSPRPPRRRQTRSSITSAPATS